MISLDEALEIHNILIEHFGGSPGLRDRNLLESALNRPFQSFGGKELYPSIIEKAAALLESIVKNHPFLDGNKRMGYVLARLMLLEGNLDFRASQDDKYNFIIQISRGELDFDQIKDWIRTHTG